MSQLASSQDVAPQQLDAATAVEHAQSPFVAFAQTLFSLPYIAIVVAVGGALPVLLFGAVICVVVRGAQQRREEAEAMIGAMERERERERRKLRKEEAKQST
jgi:membrane protein required for beta-lactamase induction